MAAAVLWGTTGTAQALAPHGAPTLAVGAARIIVGGLALLGYAVAFRGLAAVRACLARNALPFTLAGITGVAAYQLLFFAAVRSTGVALGTLVAIGCAPILAGLLGYLIHERVTLAWATATAVIIVGLVVLLMLGQVVTVQWAGVAMALGAALSYVLYTVTGRALLARGLDGAAIIGVTFGFAAIPLLVVAAPTGWGWLITGNGISAVMWLGLATTAVPYLLWIKGLASVPAASSTTFSLAEPVTATLLGVLALGEPFSVTAALGVLIVIAGLLIAGRSRRT